MPALPTVEAGRSAERDARSLELELASAVASAKSFCVLSFDAYLARGYAFRFEPNEESLVQTFVNPNPRASNVFERFD